MNPIKYLIEYLSKNSNLKLKESGERFFKESVKIHGFKTAEVTKLAKETYQKIEDKTKIFELCEELFQTGYMEESFIACEWSYLIHKEYKEEDIKIFEKWINEYVNNWATCDTLCNHTVGTYLEMYSKNIEILKKWAKSKNRWVKRASAVSLIIPARKGLFLKDIFEIADILLLDKDDMVQKGYGWMLKATSQSHQEEVFNYVIEKKDVMPRTSLRYAIEKMPKELKIQAMSKL